MRKSWVAADAVLSGTAFHSRRNFTAGGAGRPRYRAEYLGERKGKNVSIQVPQKGDKRKLVEMAEQMRVRALPNVTIRRKLVRKCSRSYRPSCA